MTGEWADLLALIPGYDSLSTAAPGDYFDEASADLAISFFPEVLTFIEGERAGEPFELENWQAAIVATLFGWKREDGTRRYRECLIYVPRKNGKTSLIAGLTLLMAIIDREPGGQLYSAAADREQASLIFRHMAGMIAQEPELAKRSRVYRSFKSIEFPGNTIYKALSSDADTKHGLSANFIVVDELHAHRDGELLEVLKTSTGARRAPLCIYITTADYNRPSICNTLHDYATKVRDGVIQDHSFLPVIYEAPQDADWTDPAVWKLANPNLGVSIREDYLERECKRALAEPTYQNTFRRLHLCQKTSTSTQFIRLEDWEACRVDPFPDHSGREAFGGLDLSTTTDLSAFALAVPLDDGKVALLPHFWIPERKLADKRDRVPYEAWAAQGLITVTDGDVVDYDRIRADIVALGQKYNIQEIRFDPWNSSQLANQLAEQDGFIMTQHRQGYISMNAPSKEFERRTVGRLLAHDGNPILKWMVGNVAMKLDEAGNIKPDKSKSTERIDGVVAAIMALSGAMVGGDRASVYSERGLFTL